MLLFSIRLIIEPEKGKNLITWRHRSSVLSLQFAFSKFHQVYTIYWSHFNEKEEQLRTLDINWLDWGSNSYPLMHGKTCLPQNHGCDSLFLGHVASPILCHHFLGFLWAVVCAGFLSILCTFQQDSSTLPSHRLWVPHWHLLGDNLVGRVEIDGLCKQYSLILSYGTFAEWHMVKLLVLCDYVKYFITKGLGLPLKFLVSFCALQPYSKTGSISDLKTWILEFLQRYWICFILVLRKLIFAWAKPVCQKTS